MLANRKRFIILLIITGLLTLLWLLSSPAARVVHAQEAIHYVAPYGDCNEVSPCYESVQAAVDAAVAGDEIRVATGIYTDVNDYGGLAQVVYVNKTITIRGGYTATDWLTANPISYPTTLDAQERGRVFYILCFTRAPLLAADNNPPPPLKRIVIRFH